MEIPEDAAAAADAAPGALLAPIPIPVMQAVLARDNARCRYCGRQGSIRLKRLGIRRGPPVAEDLISCCATCDREQGSRMLIASGQSAPSISSRTLLQVEPATPRPPPTNGANPSTNSVGGAGGGLSSGLSGPDPVRADPAVVSDPVRGGDQGAEGARARDPASHRFNHLATNTEAFLRVYHRYPNKVGKNVASQVFRELAETTEGGELALSAAILAAFGKGMLKKRPYHDEKEGVRFCPALERFLERRLWEDEIPEDAAQPSPYQKLE